MTGSNMIIDDLPSGSIWIFIANIFISFFFQFVGFVLTYLLSTSHAARYGSRAGLGLTLIQYGFYSRGGQSTDGDDDVAWPTPSATTTPRAESSAEPSAAPSPTDDMPVITSRDWLSFLLMTLGWFLLLSSVIGFWRVKRWESSIRSTSSPTPRTPEDIERDIAIRRNIEHVFGLGYQEEEESEVVAAQHVRRDELGNIIVIPPQELLEEARLARDLRAAGLL